MIFWTIIGTLGICTWFFNYKYVRACARERQERQELETEMALWLDTETWDE